VFVLLDLTTSDIFCCLELGMHFIFHVVTPAAAGVNSCGHYASSFADNVGFLLKHQSSMRGGVVFHSSQLLLGKRCYTEACVRRHFDGMEKPNCRGSLDASLYFCCVVMERCCDVGSNKYYLCKVVFVRLEVECVCLVTAFDVLLLSVNICTLMSVSLV
jgi:hypothetical protein